jgi:hypothetical protein
MLLFSRLKSLFIPAIIITIFFSCNAADKRSIEKSASAFDLKQAEASIAQSNQNFMKSFKAGDSLGVTPQMQRQWAQTGRLLLEERTLSISLVKQ